MWAADLNGRSGRGWAMLFECHVRKILEILEILENITCFLSLHRHLLEILEMGGDQPLCSVVGLVGGYALGGSRRLLFCVCVCVFFGLLFFVFVFCFLLFSVLGGFG